eukprot:CAMPEP_0202459226 /NCGR_PEP_ID=MMETSP1360-20130828/33368_1 /ASSEMBLY_ACC=CAM_ASM_000848 /TAXON_ID=515479 /ORGANISM="Licmophora paradoxa, Strain CCMP2313" /LENGTH=206 /DNA_ID=CAMNT_0049080179 /DNA_START=159 /DNA_END=776 /DNA_ORIENTATION=-
MAAPSILLGHIKQFIIRFASAIPHGLRKNFDVGYSPGSGLFGLTSLWDDEKYRFFCSMVLESDNIGTIAQSVVILIGSIDSTKLPSWWNDSKAGWLSYAKIMSSPSPSRLLLYLHVFDVAMSEVSCSSSLTAQSSPRENVSAEIMKKLVQTAERSGLKPNKHKREGICMHCQTGGTGILLCGFCDKAAHGKCCYPVIKNIASIETW